MYVIYYIIILNHITISVNNSEFCTFFYFPMDNSKDWLKCHICQQVFQDPVKWPCGMIVCRSHPYRCIPTKCPNCDIKHKEPENGFPIATKADKMSKLFYNNRRLNNSINETERLINETEPFVRDPHFYIYEYFSDLRNKADLAKEQLIQIIEQRHADYINQINELEIKCKTSAIEIGNKFCNNFEEIKINFAKLNESIKSPDLTNDQTMKKLLTEIEKQTQTIDYLINKYKIDLLQSNQCTFESSLEPIFDLKIKDLNGTNKGSIQCMIDNFITFKELSEFRKYSEWCVTKDIYWKFSFIDLNQLSIDFFDFGIDFECSKGLEQQEQRKCIIFFSIFSIDASGIKTLIIDGSDYKEHELNNFRYSISASLHHFTNTIDKILLIVDIELID